MYGRSEFFKLLSASLMSQIGSHLLTLALASYVMIESGDAVQAALVFVFSFLPSSLVSRWAGAFVDRHVSKKLLVGTDLLAMIVSAGCGFAVAKGQPLAVVGTLLAMRSILMFLQRSAMTKWLKATSPAAEQTNRFQLMLLGFFVSTAVSGLIAAAALGTMGIMGAVGVDLLSYAVGIAIIFTLKPLGDQTVSGVAMAGGQSALVVLRTQPSVWHAFVCVVGSQALFQGAYSVFVTYLPVKVFNVGSYGTGMFQLAASLGIVAGFFINRMQPGWLFAGERLRLGMLIASAAAAGVMVAITSAVPLPAALIAFFALNLGYEAIWLAASSFTFKAVPVSIMAQFQYVQGSVASVMMSLTTLAYAVAIRGQTSPAGVMTAAGAVVILGGIVVMALLTVPALFGKKGT